MGESGGGLARQSESGELLVLAFGRLSARVSRPTDALARPSTRPCRTIPRSLPESLSSMRPRSLSHSSLKGSFLMAYSASFAETLRRDMPQIFAQRPTLPRLFFNALNRYCVSKLTVISRSKSGNGRLRSTDSETPAAGWSRQAEGSPLQCSRRAPLRKHVRWRSPIRGYCPARNA